MDRQQVYSVIDGERAYQASKWGEEPHSFEEWIVYMEDYLKEAKSLLSRYSSQSMSERVGHIFRKVTAMGVAAMEQHGAPRRDGF